MAKKKITRRAAASPRSSKKASKKPAKRWVEIAPSVRASEELLARVPADLLRAVATQNRSRRKSGAFLDALYAGTPFYSVTDPGPLDFARTHLDLGAFHDALLESLD